MLDIVVGYSLSDLGGPLSARGPKQLPALPVHKLRICSQDLSRMSDAADALRPLVI